MAMADFPASAGPKSHYMISSRADSDSPNPLHDVVQHGNVGVRMAIQSIVVLVGIVECTSCDLFHKKIHSLVIDIFAVVRKFLKQN